MEIDVLKQLSESFGPSGFESEIARLMQGFWKERCDVQFDRLGSIVGRMPGRGPRVMIAAHMDEVGFLVTHITEKGFLHFQTIGGWWDHVLLAQRVRIRTRNGDVFGVIGSKPPHLMNQEDRKKMVERKNMYIDVGASSADEVRRLGIEPGDPAVPASPFQVMGGGKSVLSKAWDDRAGCACLVELSRKLAGNPIECEVILVGTVQEEVGLRGATTSAKLVKPDIAIALDVDVAGDVPGIEEYESRSKLGKGPSILLYDASMIPHGGLLRFVKEVARTEGIPIQFNAMPGGGTDAGRIHLSEVGVPSIVIGIPARHIHSHAGVINIDDCDATVRLLLALLRKLNEQTLAKILGG
ncbi:MAG TPA: M42 family metallopeptidase [Firmicutes bacterium]|nr:M42 family metallopeptidase [Bacillota bacterium]